MGRSARLPCERALAPYTYQRQMLGELIFCFHLRPKELLSAASREPASSFAR